MPDNNCPSCGNALTDETRFCGACGVDLTSVPDPSEAPTMMATAMSAGSGPSLEPADQSGRFAAGTMISERYRIVGLLGRGGMGEVYRADDLKLGQPVALKFLPGHLERDPIRLSRFLNEVRTALKVSHPNVCRVHDINDVGGRQYISMEYVDGDDLGTLLRRIGRFPQDKATEIARQLCAGIAAAHAEGILHRDLKPANIMLDGRGQVKITDFGLSGLIEEVAGEEGIAGTPSYMAPEQLAGDGASIASDVHALGLVLYEVFTGKQAYTGATFEDIKRSKASAPTSLSTHITDLDPAIERIILRCLDRNPGDRPPSAIAVAAALPGGDPLADALAAGETPDPQLVAEAGAAGGLTPRAAVLSLIAILPLLVFLVVLNERYNLASRVDLPKSTAVLEDKAREVLRDLGYDEDPVDSISAFQVNWPYYNHVRNLEEAENRWDLVERPQPTPLFFGYRQDLSTIVYSSRGSIGAWLGRSPPTNPGAVRIQLDTTGRLVWLDGVPPNHQATDEEPAGEPDWDVLLAAAGFDASTLTETEPEWLPPSWADARRAWTGVYPDAPEFEVRLEAAAYNGQVTFFNTIDPWMQPRQAPNRPTGLAAFGAWFQVGFFVVTLVVAAIVAWRNVRLGRGDHRTAVRFALFLAALRFIWFLGAHHETTQGETEVLRSHLSWSAQRFVFAYIFYLAIEPYARKLWPHMLTSWVRLFDRRFRDPLVGRDLLAGVLFGLLFTIPMRAGDLLTDIANVQGGSLNVGNWTLEGLRGFKHAITSMAGVQTTSLLDLFTGLMLILIVRLLVRKNWIMIVVISIIFGFLISMGTALPLFAAPFVALNLAMFWFVLFRFGLLAVAVGFGVNAALMELSLTMNPTKWWAGASWIFWVLALGTIAWGFWTSLAGRPVFKDEVLGSG